MVRISYSPIEEIIVHDVVEVASEDLLRERVTPAGTMPLYWCDGILFTFSSLPMTDEVVRDYLRGKVHWLEAHFAKVEKYTPIMSLSEEEDKTTMNIRIIDTSKSGVHKEFVKWLKDSIKK